MFPFALNLLDSLDDEENLHLLSDDALHTNTKKTRRDKLDLEDIGGIRSTSSRYIKDKAQIAFGISQEFYSSSIYRNKVHKMSICPNLFGQILAFFYQTIYQIDMSTTQNFCKSRILSCFYHHIVLNPCIHEINYKKYDSILSKSTSHFHNTKHRHNFEPS